MKQICNPLLLVAACACALGLTLIVVPQYAVAQVSVSITLAPPALPVYEQPVLAEEGWIWAPGYWGRDVGFYGGIDYGFGYSGHGYTGGHWQGQHFYYNTAVSHVNVNNIHKPDGKREEPHTK